jgi:dienelactone hydrolase
VVVWQRNLLEGDLPALASTKQGHPRMNFVAKTNGVRPSDFDIVITVAPLILQKPGRGTDLQVRLSAPAQGDSLTIIIFSHGNGQSLHAYGPLANYWASRGFVDVQPTHLDSRTLGLPSDDPRRPDLWRHREQDLLLILDELERIERAVPAIQGRLDRTRISVAGRSWRAQTASTLLGARHPDPRDGSVVSRKDARIKAGVLLAVPGSGGKRLSGYATRTFPFMHPDFSTLNTPTLIVTGDHDQGGLGVHGPGWWRDAYDLSPSPKALYTVSGGEHALGAIPSYESRETTDARTERVAAIQALSTAFLRSMLYTDAPDWRDAVAMSAAASPLEGALETK